MILRARRRSPSNSNVYNELTALSSIGALVKP
ncbi:hypothetical protein SAMN05444581_11921 [Methylocapsa palsarum]|uniref:Uncharacterized protein n=1 Tax=Methylocapsa palsarum TaxID=1612308 RepID=A0A1I4C7Z7_9HYPH|nr:hypothetical protein SAMN05444581_11921 [Methylocapsa palsarum]